MVRIRLPPAESRVRIRLVVLDPSEARGLLDRALSRARHMGQYSPSVPAPDRLIRSQLALPRHQTLNTTLDWSYQLLPETERLVLRRLRICRVLYDHRSNRCPR